MEVYLRSHANVRDVLELLNVTEHTRFDTIPEAWLQRQSRAIDYHPGATGHWGDYIYYDPRRRQKIDDTLARGRVEEMRVIPEDL